MVPFSIRVDGLHPAFEGLIVKVFKLFELIEFQRSIRA